MRYFKFNKTVPMPKTLKEQFKELSRNEKRLYRKAKILKHIGNVVFWIVLVVCISASHYLCSLIPEGDTLLLDIINTVLCVLLFVLSLFLSLIIALAASMPFWSLRDNSLKHVQQTICSAVCVELREFYGLCEPVLVTKCYECTDGKFKDHDVCLFFVDGELRITTNLQYGFYNINKDLGCYVFSKEEIRVSRVVHERYEATELTVDEFCITLGKKAKGFIESNI